MGTLKLIDNFQMYNLNKAEKATLAQTYKALVEEGTTSSTPDQPSVQSGEEGPVRHRISPACSPAKKGIKS